MQEQIVETKKCRLCNLEFCITDKDLEFYTQVSPRISGEIFQIPTPTLCPECREQRRLSWRNEKNFYKRNCDATGAAMISLHKPDEKYTVYTADFWKEGDWDAMKYGQDFKSGISFFEQFGELLKKVPHMGTNVTNGENSQYNTFSLDIKDCYLCSRVGNSKDIFYSYLCYNQSVGCFDCYNIETLTGSYESIDCKHSTSILHSDHCYHCHEVMFCSQLDNCSYCFASANLSGKKYYIYNKEYSKNAYFERVAGMMNGSYSQLMQISLDEKKHKIQFPKKENTNVGSEYVIGNHLTNCKNVEHGFDSIGIDTGKYIHGAIFGANQYDSDFTYFGENTLEQLSCIRALNSLFSFASYDSKNVIYSYYCYNSEYLFGCVGLQNKKYCILNKQYTKLEYEELVPQIIKQMQKNGEWGEFFPSSLSPFGYNETVASEYYPLTKTEALEKKFIWSDYEAPKPNVEKLIPASKLPDSLLETPDDILNWAIECEITGRPFRVIKQELDFYRKHNLPIPRKHPDQRHLERIQFRNLKKLYDRKCDKCSKEIRTTYSPEREEVVYCGECYDREVY